PAASEWGSTRRAIRDADRAGEESGTSSSTKGEQLMRRALFGAALIVLGGAGSAAAQSTVAFGPHDLSAGSAIRNTDASINGQTCVFCHTPHEGSPTVPLWNRSTATSTYPVYASSTMDAAAPRSAQIQSGVTGACMSCHDGSIAVDVLANLSGVAHAASVAFTRQATAKATYGASGTGTSNVLNGGAPFLGTDLRNDHPITIIYETARAATPTEFVTQAISGTQITVGTTEPLPPAAMRGHRARRPPSTGPAVVARVNGASIGAGDLEAALNTVIPLSSYHQNVKPEKLQDLRKQALDGLIDEELRYQDAVRLDVRVPPMEVEQALDRARKAYRDPEAFERARRASGATLAQLRASILRALMIQKAYGEVVTSRCLITEADAAAYYRENTSRFVVP